MKIFRNVSQAGVDLKDLAGHAFIPNHNNVALSVLTVGKKPEEQAILSALKLKVTRLSEARDSDYDNVREIYKALKGLKEIS